MAIAGEGIVVAPRPHGSSPWAEGPRFHPVAALADALSAEGERRVHWLPVFLGAGIASYFALTVEPPWWLGLAATVAAVAVAAALRRVPVACAIAVVCAFAAAGFALIQFAAWRDGTPMLDHRLGSVALTGRVIDIDQLDKGWRVIIAPDALPGLAPEEQPRRVRVRIPPTSDPVQPGDRIQMRARLYPPPAQVVPGGWDLQRSLYFAGIGAVGYSFGPARRVAIPGEARGPSWRDRGWRDWLLRLRNEMTARINAVLPGSIGGVASALITGKRGTMSEEVAQGFRDSGLAHLLAISGLHLALVGGFVFLTVRAGLALIPFVALRYPIKKIAAVLALIVMFFYLLVSGASVPTERAFVMNGIVFAAILIDRLRISMRICALAAMVILCLEPSSLIGVSFQMSFGAVVMLIAAYEAWGSRLGRLFHGGSIARRMPGYIGGVAATTVIATVGTEPFAIHHFQHFVLYGILANVVAVPISAIWTLPWGLVACLLMPFGLEALGLIPMGWGIEATIWAAQSVAGLPGNVWSTPRLPMYGLVLIVLGGLWLCLWHGRWRVWGTAAIAAGLRDDAADPPARYRARRSRPLAGGARGGWRLLRRSRRREADALVSDARDRRGFAFLAGGRGGGRGAAAMPERGAVLLHRKRPPGGAGDARSRAADRVRHGRCDRRASARGVRLPLADTDRRPDRQLALRRLRAVARFRRHRRRERQRQPR